MTTDKKQFTLRLHEGIYEKIKVLAGLNRRSVTMQIEYILEQEISQYEKTHGEIKRESD